MTGEQPSSLYLMMADSLRWDYRPDMKGTTVCTITQGNNTPSNFPAILSGCTKHGVGWFNDELQVPTVLDLPGYNVSYFDHPDDPMAVQVLDNLPRKKVSELEPPFVYVERCVFTHIPYGIAWWEFDDGVEIRREEGRKYPNILGREYIAQAQRGEVDYIQDYRTGVEKTRIRFLNHMRILKERGMLDDTMAILTSDHGDCWGDCGFWGHNRTCDHTIHVPTIFYDRYLDIGAPMLSKDIVKVWRPDIVQELREL